MHAVINSAAASTTSTLNASICRTESTATNPQIPNKHPQPDDLDYHQSPEAASGVTFLPRISIDSGDFHRWLNRQACSSVEWLFFPKQSALFHHGLPQ
jgi:hypothetical protein